MNLKKPNVVFVFADQLRRCATGFGGDENIRTPMLDQLASRSLNFTAAISGMPVCCPARASLMTGRYPHNHGVLLNDVHLDDSIPSLGRTFSAAGYRTGYIGKWHLNGRGRKAPVPPESQHGFQFWKALECTHDYNASDYYEGSDCKMKRWPGYDAFAQTEEAIGFMKAHAASTDPFCLVLSWGPPHDPYDSAPERFKAMVDASKIKLRANVPEERQALARKELAGYYAHVLALDDALGRLLAETERLGIADDTVFVFWSDHGDMLHSHGQRRKQRPWEESVHVPLLIHFPRLFGRSGKMVDTPINTPDLMPTLLGLCGIPQPAGVDGKDYTPYLRGETSPPADGALLSCYIPFGEFLRGEGGREYRGFRTARYTYAESLAGPWLLFDDRKDPYQLTNLVHDPTMTKIRDALREKMRTKMREVGDEFFPAGHYVEKWGYNVDATETVPVRDFI